MTDGETDAGTQTRPPASVDLGRKQVLGLLLVVGGFILLVVLRFVTSPIGRKVTGDSSIGLQEFLMIPLFLLLVGAGIILFLWGPELR